MKLGLKTAATVAFIGLNSLATQAQLSVYIDNSKEETAKALNMPEPNDTCEGVMPGKSISFEPEVNKYSGDIFDENGIRMLELTAEEDKALIKQQLTDQPLTMHGGSFTTPELGHREIHKQDNAYIFTINGQDYEIKLKRLKLENFKKERNNETGEIEFLFYTNLRKKPAKASVNEMADALYEAFINSQSRKKGEETKDYITIYETVANIDLARFDVVE